MLSLAPDDRNDESPTFPAMPDREPEVPHDTTPHRTEPSTTV
jgi:hypothetical protein